MKHRRTGTLAAVAVLPLILLALKWSPDAAGLPAPAGAESEPNDTPDSAEPLIPGDDVAGTIGVEGDEDWFVLDLDGPGVLTLDIDAAVVGSPLDPLLRICGPAGCADVPEGQSYGMGPYGVAVGDSWRRIYAPEGGRYTVGLRSQDGQTGPDFTYVLKTSLAPPPPAEPMSCLSPVEHGGQRGAAAALGHLYYVTTEGQYHTRWSIRRRTDGGGDTKYYETSRVPHENLTPRYRTTHAIGDLAVDAFGDLLVTEPGLGPDDVSYLSVIRDGIRHEVLDSARAFNELAIDADGDIWVSLDSGIREYSRSGEVLSEFDPGVPVDALAFAPDGTLYIISEGSLLRSTLGSAERVPATDGLHVTAMAFDAAGRAYLGTSDPVQENLWRLDIRRLDADGNLSETLAFSALHTPLSGQRSLKNPTHLTFLMNPDGTSSRKLVVGNFDSVYAMLSTIVFCALGLVPESAIPDPGSRIPFPAREDAALDRAAQALMGDPDAISADGRRLLDQIGNGNGDLDVADLYALRAHMAGGGPAAAAETLRTLIGGRR